MVRLVIDSDLHFQNGEIREDKTYHEAKIIELARDGEVDVMICAGDLTQNGTDGESFLCWNYGGKDNQVAPLKRFVKRIQEHLPVYLCEGNHDQYVPKPYIHKGVRNYVVSRHGARRYSWQAKYNGVDYNFVCLGVYPDWLSRLYLRFQLLTHRNMPTILFWHYNVQGPYSDWWSDQEKRAFLSVIEPYRNQIKLLIVGHLHETYLQEWEGYQVASGAGSELAIANISTDGIVTLEKI